MPTILILLLLNQANFNTTGKYLVETSPQFCRDLQIEGDNPNALETLRAAAILTGNDSVDGSPDLEEAFANRDTCSVAL